MLKEISLVDLKIPTQKFISKHERFHLDEINVNNEVLEYFLLNDPIIQIAIISLAKDDTRWYEFILPENTSHQDIATSPSFQVLQNFFYEVRVRKVGNYYKTMLVKKIKDTARIILRKLILNKSIHQETIKLIEMAPFQQIKPENLKIFQVISHVKLTENLVKQYENNMLIKLIRQQACRNENTYSFFINDFSLEEIKENLLIQFLSKLYEFVYVSGYGEPWESKEILISQRSLTS